MISGSNANTSGDNVASVDFMAKSGSHRLANAVMEEICQRQVITLEGAIDPNIIRSATEPADKTKAWFQTDPVTGVWLGQLKVWSEVQGAWVNFTNPVAPYVPPKRRHGTLIAPNGSPTVQNLTFSDIGTTDYKVTCTPSTELVPGTFSAPPATFPSHSGFTIVGKTSTQVSISFFGMPAPDGLMWEIDIEERVT